MAKKIKKPKENTPAASRSKSKASGAKPAPSRIRASSAYRLPSYVPLDDDWKEIKNGLESPATRESLGQAVLFNDSFKDGSITADLRLIRSLGKSRDRGPAREASIVFRYFDQNRYYYAGVGTWGSKYSISKAIPGPVWLRLNSVGNATSLNNLQMHRLRVECQGSKILLFDNDTKVVEAFDDDFAAGRWGLQTWKTQARFENIVAEKRPLQCFVIMPFAREFDGVHELINRTVTSYPNIECRRADQLSISRPIMEDVRAEIAGADMVIVDLTGRNSNVYYEAGMAAAWKKNWIVLAQSQDDLTFDVGQIRTIMYTNRMGGGDELERRLRDAIEATMGLERKES